MPRPAEEGHAALETRRVRRSRSLREPCVTSGQARHPGLSPARPRNGPCAQTLWWAVTVPRQSRAPPALASPAPQATSLCGPAIGTAPERPVQSTRGGRADPVSRWSASLSRCRLARISLQDVVPALVVSLGRVLEGRRLSRLANRRRRVVVVRLTSTIFGGRMNTCRGQDHLESVWRAGAYTSAGGASPARIQLPARAVAHPRRSGVRSVAGAGWTRAGCTGGRPARQPHSRLRAEPSLLRHARTGRVAASAVGR